MTAWLGNLSLRSVHRIASRGVQCAIRIAPARRQLQLFHTSALLDGCEPELRFLHVIGPNSGIAVDAGANEGLYTYRLAQLYRKVWAFEVNPQLAQRLRRRCPSNTNVPPFGLSSSGGSSRLYIPIKKGQRLTGWASLQRDNCPDADSCEEQQVELRSLDSLNLRKVNFIKADVEGHEAHVLAGAIETIRRDRPVVLVEVKAANRTAVRCFFSDLRYKEYRLQDLVGVEGSAENFIYRPCP